MTHALLNAPSFERFAHQMLVYRSTDELVEAVAPFLGDGVADGDAMLMVSSPDKLAAVRDRLSPQADAAITFEPSGPRYARPGVALNEFQQFVTDHGRDGRRVRMVGEPPLGSVPRSYQREMCRNEAAFNAVAHTPGASVVCPVDASETRGEVLAWLRHTHPEVAEGGVRRSSPEYTDPVTWLAHEFAHPLPEPDGEPDELLPAEPAAAREFVDERLADVLDVERRSDFVTAVHEVVANAFTHAVMDRVRLWHEDGHVVCEVRDAGSGLPDPLAGYRSPTLEQTSGWGLWLARQLSEMVEVHTGSHGSVVRLHAEHARVAATR